MGGKMIDNKFNFVFTKEQLSIINSALMEFPYRISAPLIQEINIQIQKQLEKSNEPN